MDKKCNSNLNKKCLQNKPVIFFLSLVSLLIKPLGFLPVFSHHLLFFTVLDFESFECEAPELHEEKERCKKLK